MARVPLYDNPQVQRAALPGVRIDEAPAGLASDIIGRQANQLQQGADRLIDAGTKIQLDMLEQANQLRVDDAVNQAKEQAMRLTFDKDAGFTNLRGQAALERPNGQSLADEFGGSLQTALSGIAGGLGNDRQRQLFQQRTAPILQSFQGQLLQHENNEFRTYAQSVREGTISNRMREIGLNYNNPAVIDDAVKSIQASTYDLARLNGRSAEWAEAQARKMTSNAHLVAVQAALEKNDPIYADRYLKKYAEQMDADDILRAQGLVTKEADAAIGAAAASTVMAANQGRIQPSDSDRAFNIAVGTESGGRQFDAQGRPLTSSAGAIGIAQVMPATGPEAAKLAGLPWDEKRFREDAEYNRRIGKAYFDKQLQDFGGNLPQAYAAYNAGPGATREAIREANKNGTPQQWLSYLPKETRNYVATNMAQYNNGGGAPSRPTLEDVHREIDAALGPTASPDRRRVAREAGTRLYADQTAAIKQREEEAVASVQRELIANGGNWQAVPNTLRAALPPGKFDDMMTFASKLSKKEPVQTDWDLYYTLKTDPRVLAGTNLGALRDKLGDTEFKQLTNEQQDLRQGKQDDVTRVQSAHDILKQSIREAGINPNPKPGTDDAKKVGMLTAAYSQRLAAFEATAGKKASEAEQRQIAAQVFTTVEVDRPFWLNSKMPVGAVGAAQRLEVPKLDRQQISDALKARGLPVTEDAIQTLYRRKVGAPALSNG